MNIFKNLITTGFLSLLLCIQAKGLVFHDPTHMAASLAIAKRDLVEQIRREGNQQTQILYLVDQIRQIETFLKRLGDPEQVVDLDGMKEMVEFLSQLDLSKASEEIIGDLNADEIYSELPNSTIEGVARSIEIDGEKVAEVRSEPFRGEVTMRRTVAHYREVRTEVLQRRSTIKERLQEALRQVETAKTQSELQKLDIVVRSLESQLAANDREMQFASNEVLTRFLENEVNKSTRAKLRVQEERARLKHGTEKDLGFYQLPSQPLLFQR